LRRLRPTARDYFVLKPKHSGFFDRTLDAAHNDHALRQIKIVLKGDVAASTRLIFHASRRPETSRRR